MLRLDFDPLHGGYVLWDDPVLDLESGFGAMIMCSVFLALPILPIAATPEGFAPTALCLLLGLLILLSCSERSSLIFLLPLAVPLLGYGWSAFNLALLRYSSGATQIFLLLCTLGYVLLVTLALIEMSDSGWIAGGFAVFGLLTWGCCIYSWMHDFETVGILEPILNIAFFAAVISGIVILVWWIKNVVSRNIKMTVLKVNGLLFLLGLGVMLVLGAAGPLAERSKDVVTYAVTVLALLLFALLPWLVKHILAAKSISASGSCSAILFPTLLSVLFSLAPVCKADIPCLWIDPLVKALSHGPFAVFFRFLARGLTGTFSRSVDTLFHAMVRGYSKLIHHHIEYTSPSDSVILGLSIAALFLAVFAGDRISTSLMQKRKNRRSGAHKG